MGSLNLTQGPLSQLELFVLGGIWSSRCLWDIFMSVEVVPYELSLW